MKAVFLTSPWLPAEWVKAHGLEPRGIWFLEERETGAAPAAGTCAFAHKVLELANREPEALFVFASHCDQLRRSFDAVFPLANPHAFLFNLPATWQGGATLQLYAAETERLGRFLRRHGGREPSAEQFRKLIEARYASDAQLLEEAGEVSARAFTEAIGAWEGERTRQASPRKQSGLAVPLALVGGPMPRGQWPIFDLVEELGGRIVLQAAEPGERQLWRERPQPFGESETLESLSAALARHYVKNTVDVYQRPNTRLYEWLGERLSSRGVRGILLWHYTWCDLWRAETQSLRETFGLPILPLDADEPPGELPRKTGRLQAFLESLR